MTVTMTPILQESISRLRASWSEAARTDPDAVNIDEFLGLEHPESSHSMLVQRVEELLAKVKILMIILMIIPML